MRPQPCRFPQCHSPS